MNRDSLSLCVCLLVLFLLATPLAGQEATEGQTQSNELLPVRPLYVIQPNDMLEVFVWKEPELSRKVLVRPDGRISVPLVQDIEAAGLSTAELKEQLEERLKEYLEAPNVTVIVEAIQSYQVYVIGQVQKPGVLQAKEPITVLQALSLAGGFQEYADQSEIRIIRTYGAEHISFEFNYKDVVKGKSPSQNIILRSGDVVSVP